MTFRSLISLLLVVCMVGATAGFPVDTAHSQEHGHDEHTHEEGHDDKHANEMSNQPYSIKFQTHPSPNEIVPDDEMVELMFEVTHQGEHADDVELSYRVYAPQERFWFSTDFPVVEGTQLLSGSVPGDDQVISMILPIRGTYHIKATARGPEGVTHKSFQFDVPENPQEKINLSIFLLGLFFIGGIGGFIFSKTRPSKSIGSWIIPLVLAGALFALVSPSTVEAHGEGSWDPHTLENQRGVHTLNDNAHLETNIFPQPVTVGEMLNVTYHVETSDMEHGHDDHGHENHQSSKIQAESHFVHSEGGLEMANQTSWLKDGRGSINVQLFDGAPHYLVTRFYRTTNFYAPEDDGHEHGHSDDHSQSGEAHEGGHEGTPPWEAELEYQLKPGQYTVRFHESGDPAMKWLLFPEDTDNLRDTARHEVEECQSVDAGGIIPGDQTCYNLTLNSDGTTFSLDIKESGHYRLFTQHLPREFDMTIETGDGEVVSPERTFVTGKGEFLGRTVKWVNVEPVPPPVDTIVKTMFTLLFVTGLGVFVGFKGPELIG